MICVITEESELRILLKRLKSKTMKIIFGSTQNLGTAQYLLNKSSTASKTGYNKNNNISATNRGRDDPKTSDNQQIKTVRKENRMKNPIRMTKNHMKGQHHERFTESRTTKLVASHAASKMV